ncbi:MAG: twin-arginine translocase subunit TatC [Nitrospirota bacterium]
MQDEKMPLTGHLEELRKRLVIIVSSISIGFFLSFYFSKSLFSYLTKPLSSEVTLRQEFPFIFFIEKGSSSLVFLAPTEALWMYLKVSLIAGLFLTLPIVFYQIWKFVAPGLLPKEKHYGLPFVVLSTTLFVLGAAFCFYLVLPYAIRFLLSYGTDQLTPMISVGNYIDFCLKFLLAFGLIFEIPLAIIFLARIGLVTPQLLSRNRRYSILLAFIVAALLTPTPDVFNMTLMAVPIIILYEAGIIAARVFTKKKTGKAEEE